MAEPTLLQRARERLDCARALPDVEQSARVTHIGIAVMRILEHLEEGHEAARAPQVVPERVAVFPALPIDPQAEALVDKLVAERTGGTTGASGNNFREYSTSVSDADLDALQALCSAATLGPWETDDAGDVRDEDGDALFTTFGTLADGLLIAAARDALPRLIAEVRRLQAREQRLMPALQAFGIDSGTARAVIREIDRGEHG